MEDEAGEGARVTALKKLAATERDSGHRRLRARRGVSLQEQGLGPGEKGGDGDFDDV